MSNEVLWLLFVVFDFAAALLAIRLYGKMALYVIVIVGIIICNLQVLKLINLFGFTVTLGNVVYGSIFLATDLLSECYGKKEAQKAVHLGLFTLIFLTICLQFTMLFAPHADDISHPAMVQLFQFTPRIAVASLLGYIVSQYHDVWAFHWWHKLTSGKYLWLRNNCSTMISQLLDSSIFVTVAFYGMYEQQVIWSIFYTTLFFKWIIAVLDTPVIYVGRSLVQARLMSESVKCC